jgi:hypothetical protein
MEVLDPTPKQFKNKRLPWAPLNIFAFGDLQYGSPGCDIPKLKDYIAEAMHNDAWFLFMGDAHDVFSPSNRRKYANSAFYDNVTGWLEDKMAEDIEYLFEDVLKPTAGRYLGWVEGHHLHEFTDGTTTDTRLCQKLAAPFLGTCGFMRVTFEDANANGSRGKSMDCDMWVHHGSRGTATINTLKKIAGSFSADLFFMGHANNLEVKKMPQLELGGRGKHLYLKSRDRALVATGAFDKGYQVHSTAGLTDRPRGGYVEQGAMIPSGLGAPTVTVEPVRKQGDGVERVELKIRATI